MYPKEAFDPLVLTTCDLVVECAGGIIVVRKRVPPFKNLLALPGSRIHRRERLERAVFRIAAQELGLTEEDLSLGTFLGEIRVPLKKSPYRLIASNGYWLRAKMLDNLNANREHYVSPRIIPAKEVHAYDMSATHRHHLIKYLNS